MTMTTTNLDPSNLHDGAMDDTTPPNPEVPERSKGRRQFSAKYKAKILAEYDALTRPERGALLRREGLYSSLITAWRQQRGPGVDNARARPITCQKADPRDLEIIRLKREVDRLASELDKSRRVVEIQGKLSALLEQLATNSTAENGESR
jgi:transposase